LYVWIDSLGWLPNAPVNLLEERSDEEASGSKARLYVGFSFSFIKLARFPVKANAVRKWLKT